jgi:hypothetical protein
MPPFPPPPHPSRSVTFEHAAKRKEGRKKDLSGMRAGGFGGYYSSVDLTAAGSHSVETPNRRNNLPPPQVSAAPGKSQLNFANPFVSQDGIIVHRIL